MASYLSDDELEEMENKLKYIKELKPEQYHDWEFFLSLDDASQRQLIAIHNDDEIVIEYNSKVINANIEEYNRNRIFEKPKGLISLQDVEDDEVTWLWKPYIQNNNITVLRGDGGGGKTMLACAIMSAVSNDFIPIDMPGSLEVNGSSIYFGCEDDPFIVKARVRAAGGDLNKIYIFDGSIEMSDSEDLRTLIRKKSAKLIIFDPIQSFLGSGIDMNRANEIRPILDKLREVARSESCAILLIEHLNKQTNQKSLFRGIGSIDFVSASRSVLMVGYHPTETDTRVCLQIKSNSMRGKPVAFKIDSEGVFTWQGITDVTEDEIAAASGVFSNSNQKDMLLEGIKVLISEHPSGWKGTPSEMFVEISRLTGATVLTPEAIGKRISGITSLLNKEGINWSKRRVGKGMSYEIFKSVG